MEGCTHIGSDFAPAVPSWGYLDPQILFSNSHVPPQMVVLGHFPCNCHPCLPQMLDLALKEGNESAKTSPSEWVPQSEGEEGDFRGFSTKNRLKAGGELCSSLVFPLAAAHLCSQGAPTSLPSEGCPRLSPGATRQQPAHLLQCQSNKMWCWGPPRELPVALFMNPVFGESGAEDSASRPPIFQEPWLKRKGCSDFCYTCLLCVNKCLQFYIKDGISVRALTVYFLLL